MASKQNTRAHRAARAGIGKAKRRRKVGGRPSKGTSKHRPIPLSQLSPRSYEARDNALHALAELRHNPNLSLKHAAKLHVVKPDTIKKYFPSALKKSNGKFRATRTDRYAAILYVPNAQGNRIPVKTRSSKDREALGLYLRDLGRYLRGDRNALSIWQGRVVAGVNLVTDPRVIVAIEPALAEFSLYRVFQGGGA
jgi:hypothetical protein